MSDPLADLLTRIRNALSVRQKTLSVPYSRLKEEIVKILVKQNYLQGYQVKGKQPQEKTLEIQLKYSHHQPAITQLIRLSKPGVRRYARQADLKKLNRGRGIIILSTSKGLLTADQAQKQSLGGEIICRIV